ncbi:MAG: hypothetical protein CM15mP75_3390 [Flammeovirgaceae bacterium]|nr:MAG: hypothetical protein CM15mP75_3390 [Flammeovirgaceae bacterium]
MLVGLQTGFQCMLGMVFSDPDDAGSSVISLKPSYKLKSEADQNRPNTLTTLIGVQTKDLQILTLQSLWVHLLKIMNTLKVLVT